MLQHRDVSLQPPCLKWDHPVLLEGCLGPRAAPQPVVCFVCKGKCGTWQYCISFLLVAQDEKRPTELSKTDPAP